MKESEQLALLQRELDSFAEQTPLLSEDNLFVAWFVRAYLTESDSAAIEAVTGISRDKGVDAVLIDDSAKVAYIVQAKYRKRRFASPEPRSVVIDFAGLAQVICDQDEEAFEQFLKGMDTPVKERMKLTRKRVGQDDYRLVLIFVTLGSCSSAIERDAQNSVRRASRDSSIELIDGRRTLLLLKDYLDGAAPPIPTLDVPMETGPDVKVNGVLQRYDTRNKLESWVFSVQGDAIARMFEIGGRRLFARNVRGFLGDSTPINESMRETLIEQPGYFYYYNNGITIVCDRAEKVSHEGRDILRVSNPQVINGQQTSRVLSDTQNRQHASVLVKVIQVPRNPLDREGGFDGLVGKIVQATNWQNAIRPADLMANDRRQLELEKNLRHYGYFYARKRQTKGEIRAQMRGRRQIVITKEELAQAVAGAELDPVVARSGKDNLFTESLYEAVFRSAEADFYLTRYWLFKVVTRAARGAPRRGYTKWLVLGFLWRRVAKELTSNRFRLTFIRLTQRDDKELVKYLGRAADMAYRQALRYYRQNKGSGETEVDISLFFRSKRGRDREFQRFWQTDTAPSVKERFKRAISGMARRIRLASAQQV